MRWLAPLLLSFIGACVVHAARNAQEDYPVNFELYDQLAQYGVVGSLVSDDGSDSWPPHESNPRTQWPGNKIVVLVSGSQLIQSADMSYLTRPAAFGPGKVDDEGLWGHLLPIRMFYGQDSPDGTRSNTGCPSTELKNAPKTPSILSSFFGAARKPPKDWIALVERGDCSFTDKVRLAQELGAIAVVVGDAQYEYDEDSQIDRLISLRDIPWDNDEIDQGETRPITMHPDGDTSDIVIPSCFVIRSTYLELLDLVHKSLNNSHALFSKGGKGLEVGLFLDISIPDLSALDLGMLLLFLPSILTIVFVIIQQIKTVVKQYRDRASVRAVRNLPSYEWHADRPWSLLVGSSDKEPPPKGAGIFPYVAWYLTRQFDRLRQIIARQRNRAYAPLDNASDSLTEAPVALAPQDTLPATNLPTAIPIHAASTAADIRRYAQDTCPICLCVFEDG